MRAASATALHGASFLASIVASSARANDHYKRYSACNYVTGKPPHQSHHTCNKSAFSRSKQSRLCWRRRLAVTALEYPLDRQRLHASCLVEDLKAGLISNSPPRWQRRRSKVAAPPPARSDWRICPKRRATCWRVAWPGWWPRASWRPSIGSRLCTK